MMFNVITVLFMITTCFILVSIAAADKDANCTRECLNGQCPDGGQKECHCYPCWSGSKCDHYEDKHKPIFLEKHTKVYVSLEDLSSTKSIFVVNAIDRDVDQCNRHYNRHYSDGSSLPPKRCICGETIYQLKQVGDWELFVLNSTSGQVYVPNPSLLKAEQEYVLSVLALPKGPTEMTMPLPPPPSATSGQTENMLNLIVSVQHNLGRVKRQAAVARKSKSKPTESSSTKNVEISPTSFSLRTVAGEVSGLQVGNSIHYRLEIALPRASVDLVLSIYTEDLHTNNKSLPALSLYNFTVPQRVPGITFNPLEVKFNLSNKSKNVYDHLFINCGSIKNTGPERNMFAIYFSVVLTRNAGKQDTKHAVTIGAEYGKGTYVWVAQSQIVTAPLSHTDDQVHSNVEFLEQPTKVPLNSAILFKLNANLEFRSDNFRMEISRPTTVEHEPSNLISLGAITVNKFGKNYQAIPNNASHYKCFQNKTIEEISFGKSLLDMDYITNIGEKSRTFSNNPDNIIGFTFTVYALNYKENIGKNATFTIKMWLGSRLIWSKPMNITIDEERDKHRSTVRMINSIAAFNSYEVSMGRLTQLLVKSDFAEGDGFADYSIVVEVPFAQRVPLFVPCAARLITEKSGANVPYLNEISIRPVEEAKQFTFYFDRIHFLKQRQEMLNENSVVAEIILRVPFHHEIENGTRLHVNLRAISGQKSMKVSFPLNELTVYVENQTDLVEVSHNRSVQWEDLIIGGGIAMNLNIKLPANSAFQTFKVTVRKDNSRIGNLPELNICKLSLIKVGRNLPCTCVQKDNINQNGTVYNHLEEQMHNSSYHDQAMIDFGSISVVNTDSESISRSLQMNMAFVINDKAPEHDWYPVVIDLIADDQVIHTEPVNFTINQPDVLSDSIRNMSPELNMRLVQDDIIAPGLTTNIVIEVRIAPNSMAPLDVEIISDDEELSVCGLWVKHIGDNMPCINKNEKAAYQSPVYGQNNIAKLHFDMVTNFGSNVRFSDEQERKANTLEMVAMVRVSETATTNKTIKAVIHFGDHTKATLEKELFIQVNATDQSLKQFVEPKHFSMKPADGNNITFAGIAKLIYFDIELEQNSQIPITILMEPSSDYKVCSTAFVKVGANYPCYSPNSLKTSYDKFDLGMICNTFLDKDNPNDNLLRLAMVLRPNPDLFVDRQYRMSSIVYIGPKPLNDKYELLMNVSGNYSALNQQTTKGATVHAEGPDSVSIKIRQRKWIPFGVHIPPYSQGELSLKLQGEADETRAIVVLHDLRVVAGGSNIPCPLDNKHHKLQFNSSMANSQQNVIEVNLGHFSNFGFSYALHTKGFNESDRLADNLLRLQVLAELTDHPSVTEESVYKIAITTHFGDPASAIVRQGHVKLTATVEGEPNPKIDVNIKIRKKLETLNRGDTFTMTVSLKHLPESTAEPINSVLRLFSPNYIEVIRVDWANTNEWPTLVNNTDDGSTDIMLPWILFTDEIFINFTIQIDPKNIRGYGQEEAFVVIPYRLMCEHFRIDSAVKFPCSKLKHLSIATKSSECVFPLGIESGQIADSQISASSAISVDYAPTNVRPQSAKFWSPAIRSGGRLEYLQIDFRRKTRVVKLQYRAIRGLRRVASYHWEYSDNGQIWKVATNRSRIIYRGEEGESSVSHPVEARYYRFVIDEVEAGKGKNQYLSVRLELFGCYLEEPRNSTEGELKHHRTHFTDDPQSVNRFIAVDPYTNVLYFCDSTLENHQMCYYSGNGGQSWHIIGRSIDSIEGFELATGKFFAIDYKRPSYFSSKNGQVWTPIDFDEYNRTVSHPKFQKKIVVPQLQPDRLNIRLGNWRANFNGLQYEDFQYQKAYWKNCCGLD